MEILEALAKVQEVETHPIETLIHQQAVNLSWGATLVVITGSAPQSLFDQMIQSQRVGLQVVLVLIGDVAAVEEIKTKANYLGVDCYHILYGIDLKSWAV
jgi:F0F1-type ATP synthase assembly protein I